MPKLPFFQTSDRILSQLESQWKAILDPVVTFPLINGIQLTGVVMKNGSNVINHLLGRTPQGWFITDTNAAATIYRSAPFNDKTLTLTSNAAVTVNLMVF